MTDVPCMKLVKMKGGESIAIYHKDTIDTAKRLFKDQRVGYICKADYSQNSELESIVKLLIEQMALTSKLVAYGAALSLIHISEPTRRS